MTERTDTFYEYVPPPSPEAIVTRGGTRVSSREETLAHGHRPVGNLGNLPSESLAPHNKFSDRERKPQLVGNDAPHLCGPSSPL